MPGLDEYDDVLNEVGTAKPAGTTPPVNTAPTNVDPAPTNVDPKPADPIPEGGKPGEGNPQKEPDPAPSKPQEAPQNKAFAEMRATNAKLMKGITAAAKAENLSVDEYLAKLETGALTKRAEQLQVPPEVLQRLEDAEAKLAASEDLRIRTHLASQFAKLQNTFKLTDAELTVFAESLAQKGFNFQDEHADYETLYRGLNYDKLVEKQRQEWIAESQRAAAQGSKPIGSNGTNGNAGPKKVENMDDLDSLLSEFK